MIRKTINFLRDSFELNKKETIARLILVFFIFCIIFFFYFKQENRITENLKECSFYTVIDPKRMSDNNTMYFDFSYNAQNYSFSSSVGSSDLGLFYTRELALSRRYWIQVNCDNFKTQRVLWKIPVPDTLKYIPPKGWKKIPYGLKEESVWFKRWKK